jgi:nitronate monooxygenase
MMQYRSDRRYKTKYVKNKLKQYKFNVANADKAVVSSTSARCRRGDPPARRSAMDRKQGEGMIFINCMEKLTMNAPKETLKVRLSAAIDAGIDGITLAAGLHLGSPGADRGSPALPRCKIGIIVSSLRALQLFLKKNARLSRMPDYVVVEGPLAGGHLGFGMDWAAYDLATIVAEVIDWICAKQNSTSR